jgi:hypothetical protein
MTSNGDIAMHPTAAMHQKATLQCIKSRQCYASNGGNAKHLFAIHLQAPITPSSCAASPFYD